jgi:hypothetical protein
VSLVHRNGSSVSYPYLVLLPRFFCDSIRTNDHIPEVWLLTRNFDLYLNYIITPCNASAPIGAKNKENMVPKFISSLQGSFF